MDFEISPDFMNAKEPEIVAKGMYPLIIADAEVCESKTSGAIQAAVRFDIDGNPDAKPVYMYVQAPGQDCLKNPEWTALQFKRFIMAFEIEYNAGDTFAEIMQASLGQSALVALDVEYDDKYGNKNAVNLPQLRD